MATSTDAPWHSFADGVSLPELVRYLREGVYVMDGDGRILDANPTALSLFGASSVEELANYRLRDTRRRAETWRAELAQLAADGAVREFMREIVGRDGKTRVALDTCYARGPAEDPVFHGVLVDLSTPQDGPEDGPEGESARDPVTGAFTAARLERFDAEWADAPEATASVCVAVLDDLPRLRADEGRDAANRMCVRMTRFLWRHCRATEPVIRGGDARFVLVLPETAADGVETVGRRLQLAALRTAPMAFHLGWATRHAGESCSALVERAAAASVPVRVVERAFDPLRRG